MLSDKEIDILIEVLEQVQEDTRKETYQDDEIFSKHTNRGLLLEKMKSMRQNICRATIEKRIDKLNKIFEEYEEFNKKANYRYNFRIDLIESEIKILKELINNRDTTDDWLLCLEEDKRDSEID